MAKEIKQRIVLEGEKEYNQAINEAKRNLKTLRSELKAETAELGANATAQQKNEARAKSLKEQIKEQEKIVQTLREALKEAQKEYGDNADVVATWEQKLNDARATLGNMKNDLERAGDGFKTLQGDAAQTVVATKSVADSLERVGESAGKVADSIQGIFTTVLDKVTEAANKVWELIAVTAAKANNWTDLASYYGTSASEIQKWNRSIEAAGGSFEDFIAIVNQLTYGGKETSIVNNLGISREDYQDDIEYTLAVLDKLEERKKALSQGDFSQLMEDTFGRKSKTYNWFLSNAYGHQAKNGEWISGWRENVEQWGGEGKFGINDEEILTLNDVFLQMEDIDAKWDAIKDKVAAGLGTAALNITTSVSGILDGLAEYMDIAADDPEKDQKRQAALDKIRTNMENFFRAVGDIIKECIGILNEVGTDLQNSDDPATRLIGDIMVKLSDALEWITNHYHEVVIALQAIFGAWLIAKITALAGQLSSFIANVQTIKTFKNFRVPNTGTGTGTGGTGGALGTQSITTQTVATANVTTMTVGTLIGGQGGAPATQAVNPTTNVNTTVASTPVLLGGGSAAVGLTAGSGNTAQAVLQSGAGAQAKLPGQVDSNYQQPAGTQAQAAETGNRISFKEQHPDAIQSDGYSVGEAARVTAADKLTFGGFEGMGKWGSISESVANAMTNPAVVAMAAAMLVSPLAGKLSQIRQHEKELEDYYGEDYTELTAYQKRNVRDFGDTPETAKARDELSKSGSWGWVSEIGDTLKTSIVEPVKDKVTEFGEGLADGWDLVWKIINTKTFGFDEAHGGLSETEQAVVDMTVSLAEEIAEEKLNGLLETLAYEDPEKLAAEQREKGRIHRESTKTAAEKDREAKFAAENMESDFVTPDWYKEDMTATEYMDLADDIKKHPDKYMTGYERIDKMLRSGDISNALDIIKNGGFTRQEVQHEMHKQQLDEIETDAGLTSGFLRITDASRWNTLSAGAWDKLLEKVSGRAGRNGADDVKDIRTGVESAAESGIKKGLNGMRVEIDGQYAGRILAPYISQEIARDMG